jgi:hypothetical protein
MLKRLSVIVWGAILLPLSNAVSAESFEVLVMHGSTLVRVTGDDTGVTSEVTVREDPTPPAPEIEWEPPEARADPVELVIQIFRTAPPVGYGWGFHHARPSFVRHDKTHHGRTRAMVHGRWDLAGKARHNSRSSWARASRPDLSGRTEREVSPLRAPSRSEESPRSAAIHARPGSSVPGAVRGGPSGT